LVVSLLDQVQPELESLPGKALWRKHLFAWMTRNAASANDFFRIPANRVVELGSQIGGG
jgi:KUP system potassium uptake protein